MNACPGPSDNLGVIRSVLETVDCHVRLYSQSGYVALTGPQSFFPAALTAMLTIYVAILGFRLMFGWGNPRLSDAPMMALKIGLILTLTLNWTTFQTLVFDLADKAPIEVAQIISAPTQSSGGLAADPLSGLQTAYDQITLDAAAFGKLAGPNPQILRGGEAAAADVLWRAQSALFMSTAGIMAIASIAVGVLATIGPIFIALFLFDQTRGLFAGWLRAMTAAALAPMICWITTTVLLVVISPWVAELTRTREAGAPDLQTATILSSVVFIFAAAQAALAIGGGMIAGGFQLGQGRQVQLSAPPPEAARREAEGISRVERLAFQLQHQAASNRLAVVGMETGGQARGAAASSAAQGAAQGEARVGEAYRRDAHFDRYRKAERSA